MIIILFGSLLMNWHNVFIIKQLLILILELREKYLNFPEEGLYSNFSFKFNMSQLG